MNVGLNAHIRRKLDFESGSGFLDARITVAPGECLGITGPSGSGKTTILRCLSGFEKMHNGHIFFNRTVWASEKQCSQIKPAERSIAYVNQSPIVFPHMTVENNLLYESKNTEKVSELLQFFNMEKFRKTLPKTLSGGQRQRVQLMSSLMRPRQLMLLDEPFSKLDGESRFRYIDYIKHFVKHYNICVLVVSHDRATLDAICDNLIFLSEGKVKYKKPSVILDRICSHAGGPFFASSG